MTAMSVTFKNAPLVELVAELRWGENTQPAAPGIPVVMQGIRPELEQFLMRLGGEVYQHGFQRVERLVPPGFPVFSFQPVFRYRRDAAEDNSVLFQAGPGIFSVHGVPPYRSWDNISNMVETGITALLKVREAADKDIPFSVASLRYINAFGPKLTTGHSVASFITEVLGFSIQLPEGVSKHIKPGGLPKPHVQLSMPLKDGASMSFLIAEGTVNNETTIIMDMTILCESPIAPDVPTLMNTFTNARNVIHNIFVDLTKPIEALLEPLSDDNNA